MQKLRGGGFKPKTFGRSMLSYKSGPWPGQDMYKQLEGGFGSIIQCCPCEDQKMDQKTKK